MDFYYQIGNVKTTKPWITPPPLDNVNAWWKDFSKNDLEDYQVYIIGKFPTHPDNTSDLDISLIGPIYDYVRLQKLLENGIDLGLNKHNILVDMCWYDNLNFIKYPNNIPSFERNHLRITLAGKEIKKANNKVIFEEDLPSTTPTTNLPKGLAMNIVRLPMPKQKTGKEYAAILLNPKK